MKAIKSQWWSVKKISTLIKVIYRNHEWSSKKDGQLDVVKSDS